MISPINKRKTPGKFALFAVLGIFFSVQRDMYKNK